MITWRLLISEDFGIVTYYRTVVQLSPGYVYMSECNSAKSN